jgi:mevalonate kinase
MASIPLQAEADAPDNMILFGEYAVLEGARALLMTLKHRLRVRIAAAQSLRIISDRFGVYEGSDRASDPQHVTLCKNVLLHFFDFYGIKPESFVINILSDIPPTYGFASSAALTAAMVKALHLFYKKGAEFKDVFTIGHRAIVDTFQRGSGADLAAALADLPFLVFDPVQKSIAPFDMPFCVQAIYTGYKTPTPVVLKQVQDSISPTRWREVTQKMTACIDRFILEPSLGDIRVYQSYMDDLGVTCAACRQALDVFSLQGAVAKISGSGRGDCVVGFSKDPVIALVAAPLEFLSQRDLQS